MEETNFSDILSESLDIPDKGNKIQGIVVRIDSDDVFIDFGYKSEGIVPLEEFINKNGIPEIQIGDEVEVVIEQLSSENGLPRLSKKKALLQKEFNRINEIKERDEVIEAKIIEQVKGGLIVDIGDKAEIRAFLPGSQIDIKPIKDFKELIGKGIQIKIINHTDKGIVVSRRIILEEIREKKKNEIMSKLKLDAVVSGEISNIIDAGAFADLGGVDAFIPFSEISWGKINNPNEVLNIGDKIEGKVISLEEGPRIALSIKQTLEDPWESVTRKYHVGAKVKGKVVSLKNFGVFVELEPGIEGLIHNSEITWTKKFRHPKEILSSGVEVDIVILGIDTEKKRISLSLRRIEQSPWEKLREKYPPDSKIKGTVRNVNNKGIFVEIEDGIVGLVRPDQISWKGKKDPSKLYNVNDIIDVVILNIDDKSQKVALGIKQLTADPWAVANKTYKPRESVVSGKISRIYDYGIIVTLDNELEGFMKSSEYSKQDSKDSIKNLNIGDEITALVIGFDKRKKQINLSKKQYEDWQEKQRVSEFMSSQGESNIKLGDLFGKDFKSIQGSD